MKGNKLFKKAASLMLAVVTAISALPGEAVLADTGEVGSISFEFTYDSDGNEIRYNSSATINGNVDGGTGQYRYRMFVDGDTAFCIQPGVSLHAGDTLKKASSETWNALSSNQKKAVGLALLYGYQGNRSQLPGTGDEIWIATQTLVWEVVTGYREAKAPYKQKDKTIYQLHYGPNYPNAVSAKAYDKIISSMQEHSTIPSFMSTDKTEITKKLEYKNGKYILELTDSKKVLKDYMLSCSDKNVSLVKSGNKLTISSTAGIKGTVRITAKRNNVPTVSESAKLIAYGDPNLQDVVTGVENAAPVAAYLNIETPEGTLELKKTSEDGVVEGVSFTITGKNYEKTVTTKSDGTISVKDMAPGTYTVTEAAYDRYVTPKSQTVTITGGKTSTVSFSNILKKFNVSVHKKDAETSGGPQGDATLAGAVYGLYKGDELVDRYTTDGNGQFTSKYYPCGGDWSLREISPSEGYLLDDTAHHVGAEEKNYSVEHNMAENDVNEQVVKGGIAIIKHTDNGETQIETPEEGAVFQVYLKAGGSFENAKDTERDTLTCDENGFAQTKQLPYGLYTVHQVSGWDGRELIKDFDVHINENGHVYRYIINNGDFESYLKIVKKDAESGKTIPYAGAGFQVYDPEGNLISMTFTYPEVTTIDTFYTTEEGMLITPQKLEYGTGYSLVEVQAPYGYVLNPEPISFDVVQEAASEESGITIIEVTRSNLAQKGRIAVNKTGEVFSTVTQGKEIYQPVYSVQGLPGAVYEIRAAEDITTLDGTLHAPAGELVDTITTDDAGKAVSKELYLGKYEVKEVTAPFGCVLNPEVKPVELCYAGQEIEVTETSADYYNERQKVQVGLEKLMEQDERFGIGMNGEVKGVRFGLYAAADITAADGKVIPADGLLDVLAVGEDGMAASAVDLPFGDYYVKEIASHGAYFISDASYPIHFEYGGQEAALLLIKANDGEKIQNSIIYGSVNGRKTDEDGKELAGALIGIFKKDAKEFTRETAIETATSAEDGSFSFPKVPYGTWIIQEIESPQGFVLLTEGVTVTIGTSGETVEVSLTNRYIKGNITLTKLDKDYPENKLSGARFVVYKDSNGNGKFDKKDEQAGELEESKIGIYEIKDLRYGLYFLREEEAPKGFRLDENVYPVSIEEDQKTYIVENEAGAGFMNQAQKGSLKIIKTTSDGKGKGFAFQVTGPNGYDKTFTTDASGEILIKDLRIGKYIVTEQKNDASEGYRLAKAVTVEILADETLTVNIHNEKITVEVPKTGDEKNLWVWVALLGASTAGGVLLLWRRHRKKRRD